VEGNVCFYSTAKVTAIPEVLRALTAQLLQLLYLKIPAIWQPFFTSKIFSSNSR